MFRPRLLHALCLALAPSLCACGGTDPYIYTPKEFDRNDKSFNKPVTDRTEVTICYNGIGTSDGRIADMAQAECARFDKRAESRGEGFGNCPMLVPVEAHFACLPVDGAVSGTGEAAPETAGAVPAESIGTTSAESGEWKDPADDGVSGGVVPGAGATSFGTP